RVRDPRPPGPLAGLGQARHHERGTDRRDRPHPAARRRSAARLHTHPALLRARPEQGDEAAREGTGRRGAGRCGSGDREGGGRAMSETPEMITRSRTEREVLLSCHNVTKEFSVAGNTITAVDDVSLEFPEASVLAVVGESGSGKSTLARMLLRLMPVTSGTISYRGQDVTNLRGSGLREYWSEVQAVFQDPFSSFNQFFTVGSLLRRSLSLAQVPKDEGDALIEECLGYVDMKPSMTLGKFPHQLSGGQRQRVMVARALMMRPKVLLADEATSMLDATLRVNVLNVLHDLRSELGLTVLFITHDIGQACYLADRVAVMEHGKVVERGSTEEVIFSPQADYTRRLLADVPDLRGSLKKWGRAAPRRSPGCARAPRRARAATGSAGRRTPRRRGQPYRRVRHRHGGVRRPAPRRS